MALLLNREVEIISILLQLNLTILEVQHFVELNNFHEFG